MFSGVSFEIRGRDKLCVCGPNGCGKSTLLALLLGKIPHSHGAMRLSEKTVFGHMGQHGEFLDEQAGGLDELLARFALDEAGARNLLARYGFRDVDVFKSISVLSGGERARLYLCCLLLEQPDLLLLDEPTNHLDIHSAKFWNRRCLNSPVRFLRSATTVISSTRSPAGSWVLSATRSSPSTPMPNTGAGPAGRGSRCHQKQRPERAGGQGSAQPGIRFCQRACVQSLNKAQERRENARRKEQLRQARKSALNSSNRNGRISRHCSPVQQRLLITSVMPLFCRKLTMPHALYLELAKTRVT